MYSTSHDDKNQSRSLTSHHRSDRIWWKESVLLVCCWTELHQTADENGCDCATGGSTGSPSSSARRDNVGRRCGETPIEPPRSWRPREMFRLRNNTRDFFFLIRHRCVTGYGLIQDGAVLCGAYSRYRRLPGRRRKHSSPVSSPPLQPGVSLPVTWVWNRLHVIPVCVATDMWSFDTCGLGMGPFHVTVPSTKSTILHPSIEI